MKKIALLLLISLIISCVSSPSPKSGGAKPGWVNDKYSKYPDGEYMVEIGMGSSLRDAKGNGAAALAAIFKTSIRVETSIQTRYKELAAGGAVQSSEETTFDQDLTQLADQELVNVNYGESWTDDMGQVYVLAYIDRMVTGNIYRDRIQENIGTVQGFIQKSREQSSLIREYAFNDAAYVVSQANQVLLEQLEVLNRPLRKTISVPYDINVVRNNRSEIAARMAFSVLIENDTEGNVTSVVNDELTAFGFSVDPVGILSVSGNVRIEKLELDNKYENVRFYLNIDIKDENGIPVVTIEKNDRVSAISESDAKNRAYLDIEKAVKKELIGELISYFDGFVK